MANLPDSLKAHQCTKLIKSHQMYIKLSITFQQIEKLRIKNQFQSAKYTRAAYKILCWKIKLYYEQK